MGFYSKYFEEHAVFKLLLGVSNTEGSLEWSECRGAGLSLLLFNTMEAALLATRGKHPR